VRWTRPGGGPTLWLDVPRSVDLSKLERDLATRGVIVHDTTPAFIGSPHLHGIRIGYAFLPPEALRTGLVEIAAVLRATV
jgi:DNA-binding transcriptional MocR family regulator